MERPVHAEKTMLALAIARMSGRSWGAAKVYEVFIYKTLDSSIPLASRLVLETSFHFRWAAEPCRFEPAHPLTGTLRLEVGRSVGRSVGPRVGCWSVARL